MDADQSSKRSERLSYSRQYLLSFAGLDCCQNWPPELDPVVQRELATGSSQQAPEWRTKSYRSSTLGHHLLNGDQPTRVKDDGTFRPHASQKPSKDGRNCLLADKDKRTITDEASTTVKKRNLTYGPVAAVAASIQSAQDKKLGLLPSMPNAPTLQDVEKDMLESWSSSASGMTGSTQPADDPNCETGSEQLLAMLRKGFSQDRCPAPGDHGKFVHGAVPRKSMLKHHQVVLGFPVPQQQQQQQLPPPLLVPGCRPVPGLVQQSAPLVPQALHALQRLVDHQLEILNNIQGEVTPGMLHQRLTMSIYGGRLQNQTIGYSPSALPPLLTIKQRK